MTKYIAPKLPPAFKNGSCDICGGFKNLKSLTGATPVLYFMDDLSDPGDWRCEDCIKALEDAKEQKKYLKTLK